jgi:essential nuclear protein 1
VDSNLSRKILSAAREQQRELDSSFGPTPAEAGSSKSKAPKLDDEDDSGSEQEEEDTLEPDTFYENIEINEEDEKALEMFMSSNRAPRRTLGDILNERLTEVKTHFSEEGSVKMQDLDPRVEQMYQGVRDVLRKYRSGKLPKAFKIIPNLRNWEQILFITGIFFFFSFFNMNLY